MSAALPFPLPETAFWKAVETGQLTFQRCEDCGRAWLPERQVCPNCWSPRSKRERSSGQGRVVSWVVYHIAYHEAFKNRLPYNVAVVELTEGPRMVTNLTNLDGWSGPVTDARCELVIEEDLGRKVPRFQLRA
jgi:uncharacterized protein